MSNADYLASAFVQIKPKTTGFQKELRDQVKKAVEPLKPTVNVLPTTKGFSSSLRKQVRDAVAASGKHVVPVTPTLTAFRAQLAKQLSEKPIPVTVQPIQKTPIQRGADVSKKKEIAETKELTREQQKEHALEQSIRQDKTSRAAITRKLAEVQALLAAANRQGLTAAQQELLVSKAQTIARQALLDVTLRQASAEGILSRERLKLRAAAVGRQAENFVTNAEKAIQATLKEAAASEVAQKAESEESITKKNLANFTGKLALSREQLTAAIRSGLPASEKEVILAEQLAAAKRIEAKITEELFVAKAAENTLRAEGLVSLQAEAAALRTSASFALNKAAADAKAVQLDKLQTSSKTKFVELTKVEIKALTTLDAVKSHSIKVNAVLAETEQAIRIARELGLASIEKTLVAQELLIQTRLKELAVQKNTIKQNQLEITSQKNLRRGILATSLTFLGARGATLAAGSSFLIGAAAATALAKAIGSFASLEQELNVFQATAEATAEEMERVQETAKELGRDITLPAVGASDAAQAMTQLAKAGLDVEDAMDGARGTLQLATAAEISNAEATELVASALNSFGLAGIEAARVADLLTGAANEAQGTITDMGIALQQSSAVARQAGLSLEDTVAFITLLAKNGIRGSDAGTSLRTALLRLISPTEQANKLLHQLGITIIDTAGNLRPEAFSELSEALSNLNTTARNQALRKIFGQDAIRAAVIFGREGSIGLNAVREATQEVGLASKLAEARTRGFSGQVAALRNNAETLGLTLGKLSIGPLSRVIETLSEATQAANDLKDAFSGLGDSIPESGGGASGGFTRFVGSVKDLATSSLGDTIRELRAVGQIAGSGRGGVLAPGQLPTGRVKEINREILKAVSNTKRLAVGLSGVETPEDAIGFFENLRGQIIGTSEDAELARKKIDLILDSLFALGRVPTVAEIAILFDTRVVARGIKSVQDQIKTSLNKLRVGFVAEITDEAARAILLKAKLTGENAADLFHAAFKGKLTPEEFNKIMERYFSGIPSSIQKANESFNDNLLFPSGGGAKGLSGKEILGRIAGFDAAKVRAELSGSTAELIAVLRAEQAFLNQQLGRELVKKQPGLKRQIESALLGVQNDLAAIAEDSRQKAKEQAEKIKQDRRDAAEKVISAFSSAERKAINDQAIANQTESLRDDISTAKRLLAIYEEQKRVARKKIKDAEILADFLADVNQKIFEIELEITRDKKALRQQIRQERREAREKVITGLELDIELAEINENRKREISLRRKLIKALEDQIKHEKGNKLKIKELRNEIARQKQAIRELIGETKDRNNAFAEMSFQFLQIQSGFAANLLGNLIPLGATGGLVGGSATGSPLITTPTGTGGPVGLPVGGLPGTRGAFPEGRPGGPADRGVAQVLDQAGKLKDATGGPTRGGQATELQLLRNILAVLQDIRRGTTHKNAQNRRGRDLAAMELAERM